jgi:hypothetical protein
MDLWWRQRVGSRHPGSHASQERSRGRHFKPLRLHGQGPHFALTANLACKRFMPAWPGHALMQIPWRGCISYWQLHLMTRRWSRLSGCPHTLRRQKWGVRRIGNGDLLSVLDRYGNDEADTWAKHAVEEHRVPYHIRKELKDAYALVGRTAKWIGAATWHANHSSGRPGRDTGASRQAAVAAAKTAKARRGERQTNISKVRSPAMGGHDLVQVGTTWQCLVCREWSHSRGKLETKGCPGSVASKWKRREVNAILKSVEPGTEGSRVHRRMISGDVIWCSVCGSYGEHRARGLEGVCDGKDEGVWKGGGRVAQLKALLANTHPKDRTPLPPAVTESQWLAGERPVLVKAMVGQQSSAPVIRLCPVSSCILARIRAAKRQADRETASDEEVGIDGGSGSSSSISKRRRITGKTMPATPGGTIVIRPSLGADPQSRS